MERFALALPTDYASRQRGYTTYTHCVSAQQQLNSLSDHSFPCESPTVQSRNSGKATYRVRRVGLTTESTKDGHVNLTRNRKAQVIAIVGATGMAASICIGGLVATPAVAASIGPNNGNCNPSPTSSPSGTVVPTPGGQFWWNPSLSSSSQGLTTPVGWGTGQSTLTTQNWAGALGPVNGTGTENGASGTGCLGVSGVAGLQGQVP
jgi:hypothetical protein